MKNLIDKFNRKYGFYKLHGVISPLRICPLGAHVDHQGGLVTGVALNTSVNMVYSPNDDRYIRIQSLDFPDEEYFHVDRVPEMLPGGTGSVNYRECGSESTKKTAVKVQRIRQ